MKFLDLSRPRSFGPAPRTRSRFIAALGPVFLAALLLSPRLAAQGPAVTLAWDPPRGGVFPNMLFNVYVNGAFYTNTAYLTKRVPASPGALYSVETVTAPGFSSLPANLGLARPNRLKEIPQP